MKKAQREDLAVFGGQPAFRETLHVGRPNPVSRAAFAAATERIFDRNILTNDGPEVRALEGEFRRITGSPEAIAVTNATLGLQLVARAMGLRGRVAMPAYTFAATAHAFQWLDLEPVFCDVLPDTHVLDCSAVTRALELDRSIGAVVGVHLWGNLCAPDDLESICRRLGRRLIFDSAHALGCRGHNRAVGCFGDAEVFSLHATKICHSFEGGMITTRDATLATRLRHMRNFGFVDYDAVECLGINAKMSEISAAMGRLSLASLEEYREHNRLNSEYYRTGLMDCPSVYLREPLATAHPNYQYVVMEFDPALGETARDTVYGALRAEGVLARRYFYPGCHRMPPYGSLEQPAARLPVTESLCARVLCLPTGMTVTPNAITRICELLAVILEHLPAIARRLERVR